MIRANFGLQFFDQATYCSFEMDESLFLALPNTFCNRGDSMRRISISELSTLRWSFYQDAVRYASLGFHSIGVWRQKVDEYGHAAAIDLLYEMKMGVSSVHWAGAFTGSDGKSYNEAIDDAEEAIQLAALLDADCLIVHSGSRNGHTNSHAKRLFFSALRTLVPIASDFGVRLAVEPMFNGCAGSKWTIIEKLDDMFSLVEEFPGDQVGLVLDLYHVGLESGVLTKLDELVDHIALVQLADREQGVSRIQPHQEIRRPLGMGDIPLKDWLGRLQQAGYSGSFEVELHGVGMEKIDYFHMLDATSDFLGENAIQPLLELANNVESVQPKRNS